MRTRVDKEVKLGVGVLDVFAKMHINQTCGKRRLQVQSLYINIKTHNLFVIRKAFIAIPISDENNFEFPFSKELRRTAILTVIYLKNNIAGSDGRFCSSPFHRLIQLML